MWYLDLTNHQRSALMEHAPRINDLLVKLERKMEGRSVADPPHPNDFNRTRRAVVDAARPFADKPALSDTEKVAFDALVEVTDSLGNAADKAARQRELNDEAAAAFGRPVDGRGSVTGWVDANGRPVAVLAPEDRLSSADGGDFRDLHIGSLMRAERPMRFNQGLPAIASEVSSKATARPVMTIPSRMPFDSVTCIQSSVAAAAGRLPVASRRTTCQSTFPFALCRPTPNSLVSEA